ncbi:uncharacterized protein LOC111254059 [Varroa destructor]|uniref:Uncharacterized protein n=1 Tax=Varroa destructor TaxID=109461 RepID=A0A7M7KV99_VARDE|nr:uncharacterized protein LOC111254059 [Varroa destructor]XP_022670266.1 uncharacterized protein LOC111254059 [Varroa destructor]
MPEAKQPDQPSNKGQRSVQKHLKISEALLKPDGEVNERAPTVASPTKGNAATEAPKPDLEPKASVSVSAQKAAGALDITDKKGEAKKSKPPEASSSSSDTSASLQSSDGSERKKVMTVERLTEIGDEVIKLLARENSVIKQRIQTLNRLTTLVLSFTENARKQTSIESLLPDLEELIRAFAEVSPNDFRQKRRRSKSAEAPR